ncbi:MAG: acetyl-CoA carboxylase, carboxyltransferase subunit beta [candidate division FCPU426 bacterium]
MAWFKRPKYTITRSSRKTEVPQGVFQKCEQCGAILVDKELADNFKVCPKCSHHMLIPAGERVAMLIDEGTWNAHPLTIQASDPLKFPDYAEKLKKSREKTGLGDALVKGDGLLAGIPVALGVTEFAFMGGSMGSVVGEEMTRLIEFAAEKRLPLILVSGSGGGARMHEGILSLMQMAKTSAALARLHEAGCPFLSVLTHPTGGGVTASWAILGDMNLAEPKALIMFAGARVIEQTIRQRLPKDFQRSEFLQEHGVVDLVVDRRKLKATLALTLSYLKPA